jgi:hypothetical protein
MAHAHTARGTLITLTLMRTHVPPPTTQEGLQGHSLICHSDSDCRIAHTTQSAGGGLSPILFFFHINLHQVLSRILVYSSTVTKKYTMLDTDTCC